MSETEVDITPFIDLAIGKENFRNILVNSFLY